MSQHDACAKQINPLDFRFKFCTNKHHCLNNGPYILILVVDN